MSKRYKKEENNHPKSRKQKVIKYRKPININIGMIVFGIIFLYIIINIVRYINNDHVSIYEVTENNIADDNTCRGIIIRNETVVTTDNTGYVNYFLRDGERAAKNSIICIMDETRRIFDDLAVSSNANKLSNDDNAKIYNIVTSFQKSYSDNNFSDVYSMKYDLNNALFESTNFNMIKDLEDILKENGQNSSFEVEKAKKSGIVSYSIDGMENLKKEDITEKTFDRTSYKRQQLRTDELVAQGSPIYKVVTDENWSIILSLTKDQYDRIQAKKDNTRMKITFPKDGLNVVADITPYIEGGNYYAKLDLSNYMIRYINERYIDVELTINSAEGLKIPVSAIVEKDFYKIPIEYFTIGGNSDGIGLTKEIYDKDNNLTFAFIPVDKYYEDEKYAYISKSTDIKDNTVIQADDWIHNLSNGERYRVGPIGKLTGVYNINKGYPVFKQIEKEYENKEYCIIKKNTAYGLSEYDHIILNAHLLN